MTGRGGVRLRRAWTLSSWGGEGAVDVEAALGRVPGC